MAAGDSEQNAALNRACTALSADARTLLQQAAVGSPMLACFTAATAAGATADNFNRFRSQMAAETPSFPASITVRQMILRMCLAEESRAVSNTVFTSRDQVETTMVRMIGTFGEVQDHAADNKDANVYQEFVALQAAVARDLSVRGRPLPKMVSFAFRKRPNALWLANRLYGDAARADELIGENSPVHPAFMPETGRALSQ
ncbi:hypothetical protein [Labrys miyagiensis]